MPSIRAYCVTSAWRNLRKRCRYAQAKVKVEAKADPVTADGRRKAPESAGPRSPVTARPCPFPLSPSLSSFRARPPSLVSGLVEAKVTYTLFHEGSFYVIEHVPARVCQETGEEFFAPETVERIQALVKGKKKPDRMVRTPVYEYA